MFISQVIFEGEKTNEEIIMALMHKKSVEASNVKGLLSTERWLKNGQNTVGFSIVCKWESREHFKAWFSTTEHGHRGGKTEERPPITKTAYQFETVDDGV
ncbi:MAG: antibiotic biosynthesis monooxygenase [Desulfovibrio sp.]|jgi:heme-degrading monooxygenase HmoA|nr:antibiotic biosynthesis monooxygenase [Desulfovibrio sp.]